MAKKIIIKAGEQVVNMPEVTSMYAVSLMMGGWKDAFSDQRLKILLAEALNYCSCYEGLVINGYLITTRRLCLVLDTHKTDKEYVLLRFFECLRRLIRESPEINTGFDPENAGLFRLYPLSNEHLIKLLTGRPVVLPYYDKNLERLKDRIIHADFCSAIDYSGAKGPVILHLLKK